jgi:hypothetical protein
VTDDDADDSKLITEESGVPDGEVKLSVDDTNEDTASAEEQGVSDEASVQDADEMDARYGQRASRYNLRQRKKPSFTHLKTFSDMYVNVGAAHANVGVPPEQGESPATAQMSMNKGLKLFGEAGIEAVRSEMAQLHDRKVMKPVHSRELTPEERREALASLMFLKWKRCGKVMGRGCADGWKQRRYTDRADAASPIVATEAVFLMAFIDAIENRDVAVVDIPGAFMQVDLDDETIHVRLTGKMVELLLEIDHELYESYLVCERGEMVMYVELLKALYGTMRAARLFWERLSKQLVDWGFTPNPYDSCVVNKMVDGKQLTVAWHVDDLKILHVSAKVVDDLITDLDSEFGKETPLSKLRGKVHDYLWMTLDFSVPGQVTVTMIDYIKMICMDLPKDMVGKAATPAANHLFRVDDEDAAPLDKDRADVFVHLTMQLLFLSQRARPDIRTAISFLCGCIQHPNGHDYKKLTRVMKYLQSTIDFASSLIG